MGWNTYNKCKNWYNFKFKKIFYKRIYFILYTNANLEACKDKFFAFLNAV